MSTPTYEILDSTGAARSLHCLLCGFQTAEAASLERLFCPQCRWFHERLDARGEEVRDHIRQALNETGTALELAQQEDPGGRAAVLLAEALRQLRLALSEVG